ncbi:MAG: SCP2 sterol-binding domain-containing protein [Defluviitaleaceae bacterium]|nr:SCP2 sterol-binding domain-containing protein [Defluviitaleaceae bacterium]
MKIAIVYGNMTHYDHGLGEVTKRLKGIFSELEAECESLDLGAIHPPYYDGETTKGMDDVIEKLRAADGVILACTAQMFAPTALMQSFIEYLEDAEYADVFAGKRCMLIALARESGEKSALDYLARVTGFLGGFVVAQIGIQKRHLGELDGEIGEILDRSVEDFYRAVKQERKYIIPSDFSEIVRVEEKIVEVAAAEPAPVGEPEFVPTQKLQLQSFSSVQEKEIEELSNLFTQKFSQGEGAKSEPLLANGANALDTMNLGNSLNSARKTSANEPPNPFAPTAGESAAGGTVEELTRALPKKFQQHLSAGLQATLQISISSPRGENFDGFLHIHSTECTYTPGVAPGPDITIMADSNTWNDVISGKTTAQKAFMIGGIKVRGDFVLLTKFDMLFNEA